MDHPRHHHSLFWPTLLIGVGIVWLLVNFGIIAPVSVATVLQFWPVLLVLLGLDILFRQRYAWVGGLVGLLAVAGVVAFLIVNPNPGAMAAPQSVQENFTAPLSSATSVNYDLETAAEPVDIYALSSTSTDLIDADLTHQGQINFNVSGTTNKQVSLSEISNPNDWLSWAFTNNHMKWNVGLAAGIPTDITLNGGSGSINADLGGIKVRSLTADLGSGSSNFSLVQADQDVTVDLNSGSGSVNISLPAETNVTLLLQSGSGSMTVQLPATSAVRVEVMDSGSGSLNLPGSLTHISGDNNIGTWQSEGYDQANERILIKILDRGSGSISIQ